MTIKREDVEHAALGVRDWLRSPNIVFVGVRTDPSGEHRLEVRVVKKKKIHELGPSDFPIPRAVPVHVRDADGNITEIQLRTDVVETGPITLASLNERVRPAPGGYRISVAPSLLGGESAGTLGCNMVWGGRFRLLTNNHVIAHNQNIGATVYQPEDALFGNALTTVSGFCPVTTTTNRHDPYPVYNNYDFAYCDITALEGATNVVEIGQPTGIRGPDYGEQVKWIGERTGTVQATRITGTTGQAVLEFTTGNWAFFQNVMTFASGTVAPGDSGSAVVAVRDMNVVGLVFARDAAGNGYAVRLPPY